MPEISQKELAVLQGKANAYDDIEEFYRSDSRVAKYREKVSERLIYDQCYSMSSHIIGTIEAILDEYEYWFDSSQ